VSTCASIRLYAIVLTVSSATSLPALPRTLAVSFAALLRSFWIIFIYVFDTYAM
jgi:hypothetical protein